MGEVEFRTLNKAIQHVKLNRVGKGERGRVKRKIEREKLRGRETKTDRKTQRERLNARWHIITGLLRISFLRYFCLS